MNDATIRSVELENTQAYLGSLLSLLVPEAATGGGLSALVAHSRPGSEPPPHVHHHEHELYYVLEGEVDFFVEGVAHVMQVRPGNMAFLPSGRAHAMYFRTPTRFITIIHGVVGAAVTSEAYRMSMATGPAQSLELPLVADRYATIDLEAMEQAVQRAAESGVTFLSPEETRARLPHYQGFSQLPRAVEQ